MARLAHVEPAWSVVMPEPLASTLFAHLFPGDDDEHGAVIAAGVAKSPRGNRLLVRDLFIAKDGVDYVAGERGYRMLCAEFVTRNALRCRDERLAYLAVHNHDGTGWVDFSPDDLASHERGYRALLDILHGQPVGALVFSQHAVAGDIWFPGATRARVTETRIIGAAIQRLFPSPPRCLGGRDHTYDRQARVFGDAGQDLLRKTKVGVIGAGGVGSLLVEYLGRLGVGWVVVADPERLDITNLPRVAGSRRWDARTLFTMKTRPEWLRRLGARIAARKVDVSRRMAREANPRGRCEVIFGDIVIDAVARRFVDCDYIFLAADTNRARLVWNSLVHQYLIPGYQVGVKVPVSAAAGEVGEVFAVARPVTPSSGCLWCNGLISSEGLQREAATPSERRAQRYVDEPEVAAPSVITLNATVASQAANDFLFSITGLTRLKTSSDYLRFLPRDREVRFDAPRRDAGCPECGAGSLSRLARGDSVSLPTKLGRQRAACK
jgi:molybdopterin/thiamine biosynthesis adenylyltransferase